MSIGAFIKLFIWIVGFALLALWINPGALASSKFSTRDALTKNYGPVIGGQGMEISGRRKNRRALGGGGRAIASDGRNLPSPCVALAPADDEPAAKSETASGPVYVICREGKLVAYVPDRRLMSDAMDAGEDLRAVFYVKDIGQVLRHRNVRSD